MSGTNASNGQGRDWLSDFCELNSDSTRRAYLAQKPELLTAETVTRLADVVRESARVDVEEALRVAEGAVIVAELLGDLECEGAALRSKANALWVKGQCRPAADLLGRAVQLFNQAGNSHEVGRTLSTSIQPLMLLGDYENALANAEKARAIFTRSGDKLRLARLDLNLANILHRQERFTDAFEQYERAYEQLLGYSDTEGIGVALHNMAVCLISLNHFERALGVHNEAVSFLRDHNMPVLASQAGYNIAYLYYLRGDYELAMDRLRVTRENCTANGDAYHAALCDLDQSEIYVELNLADEALRIARRAVEQFEKLGMGYELARSLINLAIASNQLGQPDRAIAAFARAKEIFLREGHRAGEALVDLYRAILLLESGNLAPARELCLGANAFFRSCSLFRKSVTCDLLLAHIALAEGNTGLALDLVGSALERLKTLEAPLLSHRAYLLLGHIHEQDGDSDASWDAYQHAREDLESLRSSLQGEELRIAFMKNKLDVYERLVCLCLKRGSTGPAAEEALRYIEQAKCRSLMDSLFGRAHPLPSRIAANTHRESEILELRGRLNWYYHRIETEELSRDSLSPNRIGGIGALWSAARRYENELLEIVREIPRSNLGVQELHAADPIRLSDLQDTLGSDSTMIEYYQAGENIIAAVIGSHGLNICTIASVTLVRKRLRLLRVQLSKPRFGASYVGRVGPALSEAIGRHLRELYELLFAPLEEFVSGKHIVFVPHGPLHYIPFHALHDGSAYLIDRHTVSYSPSGSIYALCHSRKTNFSNRSLVLGIHDAQAPWILQEVQEVAAVVRNPTLLLGNQASREALSQLGPECGVIHIATHGFFRRDNPMFSAVRLGDSYLSHYDLYSLRLSVELLTLSGCATGLNVVTAGDELIGLTRGLLYAGANTLLLSLWDVHDRSAKDFMRSFYTHLDNGSATKAEALRAAMHEVREQYPHPYYWAAFMLVGKGS